MRKFAIITGGSRGIGRAITEKLAQDTDYHLLITYQSNEIAARETLGHVKKLGREGEIIRFDVSDHQSTVKALTQWQHDNKDAVVEVIVNNAGINRDGLFMWMPPKIGARLFLPRSMVFTTLLTSSFRRCCVTATGALSTLLRYRA